MDWLLRTRTALEACRQHVDTTSSSGSEVEAYLSQYLLVVLCAEMQEEMYRVVEMRAKKCGDEGVCSFVLASSKKILRSVKVGEISGFVAGFGVGQKNKFSSALDERAIFQYNSAVESRHSVAHKSGAQVTLSDMVGIIESAELVLESVLTALVDDVEGEKLLDKTEPALHLAENALPNWKG